MSNFLKPSFCSFGIRKKANQLDIDNIKPILLLVFVDGKENLDLIHHIHKLFKTYKPPNCEILVTPGLPSVSCSSRWAANMRCQYRCSQIYGPEKNWPEMTLKGALTIFGKVGRF